MRAAVLLVLVTAVAGCGIDGPPERPAPRPEADEDAPRQPGAPVITIGGSASAGIVRRP